MGTPMPTLGLAARAGLMAPWLIALIAIWRMNRWGVWIFVALTLSHISTSALYPGDELREAQADADSVSTGLFGPG